MSRQNDSFRANTWASALRVLGAVLLAVAAVDICLQTTLGRTSDLSGKLKVQPQSGGIYLLGNSMFKTGIDLDTVGQSLPRGQGLDFAYYDGQYTSLWYLIVRNAILPSPQRPAILVWGFRPTYAMYPGFRQRRAGPIEEFSAQGDPVFSAIAGRVPVTWGERFLDRLGSACYLFGHRDEARSSMSLTLTRLGLRAIEAWTGQLSAPLFQLRSHKNTGLADLLVRRLTGGRSEMAEEGVVDVGPAQFMTGEKADFESSFVPAIARLLQRGSVPQLVIIFKPVKYVHGTSDQDSWRYYLEAKRFFEARDIPFLDLIRDGDLSISDYAQGDHHNASGRAQISKMLGQRLATMTKRLEQ